MASSSGFGNRVCWPFVFMSPKRITYALWWLRYKMLGKNNARVIIFSRWPIYSFLSERGENVIREWLKKEKVPKTQVAIFQAKIDLYERGGPGLTPGFIEGPVAKNIYKMKIKGHKGHMQLRPMVCYGPFLETEVTMLVGAVEKDFKLRPENCKSQAQEHRETLLSDRSRRRHEPVGE